MFHNLQYHNYDFDQTTRTFKNFLTINHCREKLHLTNQLAVPAKYCCNQTFVRFILNENKVRCHLTIDSLYFKLHQYVKTDYRFETKIKILTFLQIIRNLKFVSKTYSSRYLTAQ